MRIRKFYVISLICLMVVLNYEFKMVFGENVQQDKIKDGAVVLFSEYQFIIKFSNLIFEKNGKELLIPIFQGDSGDVHYKVFLEYCYKNKFLQEGWGENAFVIKANRGKLTKTFHEFLMFYKSNILKDSDITKPAKMIPDGGALELYYDFQIDGIPFVLQVNISTVKDDIDPEEINSILEVGLDEKMKTPIFTYRFLKNKTSKKI